MRKLFYSLVCIFMLAFASCSSSEKPANQVTDTVSVPQPASVYTCPMHPEVLRNAPGSCPECKMDLIIKSDEAAMADSNTNHDSHQH